MFTQLDYVRELNQRKKKVYNGTKKRWNLPPRVKLAMLNIESKQTKEYYIL